MVDLMNIGRVNQLAAEKQSIISATDLFSRGGRIVAFGINPPDPYDGPSPAVSVVSSYMEYPPQMLTQISALMQARLAAIQSELTEMGITGLDQAQPRAVQPQSFGAGSPPPGMRPPTQGPKASQFVGPKK